MSDFIILTDSSADLSGEMAQAADVQVLPLTFTIGGADYHNYPDNREMDPHLFYQRLRAGEVATTAAVNMNQYVEAIEPLLQAGRDVLVLAFSSGLSATFQSSKLAVEELSEKYPERKLYTVDTLCASLGQGLLVWYAAQERKKGRTIEEVRDWAEANKLSLCHQFTVDDLHFLKRGGRISATTAVVGSMLQIKPVLHVDDEGHLINIGKARGRQSSLKALVDKMEKTVTEAGKQTVFISHGDCLEDAQLVAQRSAMRYDRDGSASACPRSSSTTSTPSSAPTPAPAPWLCFIWALSAEPTSIFITKERLHGRDQMAGSGRQHHPGPPGRGDRQADRRGHDRAGHRG